MQPLTFLASCGSLSYVSNNSFSESSRLSLAAAAAFIFAHVHGIASWLFSILSIFSHYVIIVSLYSCLVMSSDSDNGQCPKGFLKQTCSFRAMSLAFCVCVLSLMYPMSDSEPSPCGEMARAWPLRCSPFSFTSKLCIILHFSFPIHFGLFFGWRLAGWAAGLHPFSVAVSRHFIFTPIVILSSSLFFSKTHHRLYAHMCSSNSMLSSSLLIFAFQCQAGISEKVPRPFILICLNHSILPAVKWKPVSAFFGPGLFCSPSPSHITWNNNNNNNTENNNTYIQKLPGFIIIILIRIPEKKEERKRRLYWNGDGRQAGSGRQGTLAFLAWPVPVCINHLKLHGMALCMQPFKLPSSFLFLTFPCLYLHSSLPFLPSIHLYINHIYPLYLYYPFHSYRIIPFPIPHPHSLPTTTWSGWMMVDGLLFLHQPCLIMSLQGGEAGNWLSMGRGMHMHGCIFYRVKPCVSLWHRSLKIISNGVMMTWPQTWPPSWEWPGDRTGMPWRLYVSSLLFMLSPFPGGLSLSIHFIISHFIIFIIHLFIQIHYLFLLVSCFLFFLFQTDMHCLSFLPCIACLS